MIAAGIRLTRLIKSALHSVSIVDIFFLVAGVWLMGIVAYIMLAALLIVLFNVHIPMP